MGRLHYYELSVEKSSTVKYTKCFSTTKELTTDEEIIREASTTDWFRIHKEDIPYIKVTFKSV